MSSKTIVFIHGMYMNNCVGNTGLNTFRTKGTNVLLPPGLVEISQLIYFVSIIQI